MQCIKKNCGDTLGLTGGKKKKKKPCLTSEVFPNSMRNGEWHVDSESTIPNF